MTDDECTYCHGKFAEGDEILVYDYPNGQLVFCGTTCAGNWFTENECVNTVFKKGE